jgi:hypothetical protein
VIGRDRQGQPSSCISAKHTNPLTSLVGRLEARPIGRPVFLARVRLTILRAIMSLWLLRLLSALGILLPPLPMKAKKASWWRLLLEGEKNLLMLSYRPNFTRTGSGCASSLPRSVWLCVSSSSELVACSATGLSLLCSSETHMP